MYIVQNTKFIFSMDVLVREDVPSTPAGYEYGVLKGVVGDMNMTLKTGALCHRLYLASQWPLINMVQSLKHGPEFKALHQAVNVVPQ